MWSVVFVHGFTGHPVRTWTHKTAHVSREQSRHDIDDGKRPTNRSRLFPIISHSARDGDRERVYWPKHLLPEALPSARIFVYGYDTNLRHSFGTPISKNTVSDIAWDLLGVLEAERRAQPSRPIIFVAHSLGGIVVKDMLRRSWGVKDNLSHLRQIFESTAAIMFFGTPHCGADPRGLRGHVAEQILRAAGFTVNQQVLDTLLPTSERLRELRDEFGPMARREKWIIHSFQEQYGVRFLGHKKGS